MTKFETEWLRFVRLNDMCEKYKKFKTEIWSVTSNC